MRARPALFAVLLSAVLITAANAQQAPWDDYSVHIKRSEGESPLSVDDALGDKIDFYNGQISFSAVDIDLPGSNKLPVRLARTYQIKDSRNQGYDLFSDWELDVPYVSGIFAREYQGDAGYSLHTWSGARCSGSRSPPYIALLFPALEYWNGLSTNIPNGGPLLEPAPTTPKPTAGESFPWVTPQFTWLSCLPTVGNSAGEGFLAISPDGTKYWFNWMAVYPVWQLDKTTYGYDVGGDLIEYANSLTRRRHVLYATRVEDRHGNWVNYNYSNNENSAGRLNSIESSDGRRIDISYDAGGRISSATANGRTWTYSYTGRSLSTVVQPDTSRWAIDLSQLLSPLATTENLAATCSFPYDGNVIDPAYGTIFTARLTAPSGVSGEFQIERRLHGRSNVPKNCLPSTEILMGDMEAGYHSDYVRMYWTLSVTKKAITGPGLSPMTWQYNYRNSFANSDTLLFSRIAPSPIPVGSWAQGGTYNNPAPSCVSDSCAGRVVTEVSGPNESWTRYTFGNSYRYDENKLLRLEIGKGPNSIARIEDYKYDLRTTGTPYPSPIGYTLQYQGDDVMQSFLRPMREKSVTQDGITHTWMVNSFDNYGRPASTTSSTP